MTDPRMLGTLNLINRSLESIAASLSRIAAKLDASITLVATEPAEPEGTDPDEELR